MSVSPKSKLIIALLSFPLLFGIFGLHRIYLRDYWWGLPRLLGGVAVTYEIRWNDYLQHGKFAIVELGLIAVLFSISLIWSSVDFILGVIGKTRDANGLIIKRWW